MSLLMADSVAKFVGIAALVFRRFFLSLHQFVRRDWLLVLFRRALLVAQSTVEG
jgi:hypothetical protein